MHIPKSAINYDLAICINCISHYILVCFCLSKLKRTLITSNYIYQLILIVPKMFSIKNTINVAFTILFNGFLAFRMCIKRPKRKMVCFFNVVCTEITEDILLAQESFALWSIFLPISKRCQKCIFAIVQYLSGTYEIPIRLISASPHLKEIPSFLPYLPKLLTFQN